MRDLLANRQRPVLEALAGSRSLLAFDFDGTLAPVVSDRTRAALRPRTHRLLAALCTKYPVAVVSGRARGDVAARLEGLGVKYVAGNHGIEPVAATAALAREVATARRTLELALDAQEDVDLEDKRFSLSLHFRRARHPAAARRAILAAVRELPGSMRASPGKAVVNVVPAGAPTKGDAVKRIADAERAERVLYVGDDVTDEDAFSLDDERLVAVRVGRAASSAAPWFVPSQRAVDDLLSALSALRA